MKNLKPIIFIVIVLVLTAISSYPQRKFYGQVTEIVDGKTCVIQLPGGQVIAVLEYIETPEPEQAFYKTAKEHLQALVLGKQVEFMPRIVMADRTIGRLLVNRVDISQQMLRDGAAWYSIPEKDGQEKALSLLYQDNEKQAKTEKRGVWSVENLKPAWEYRAEQADLRWQKQQQDKSSAAFVREMRSQKKNPAQNRQTAPPIEMWADVGGANQFDQPVGFGGLRAGYDAALRLGHISTPSFHLDFPNAGFLQKVESRLFYIYRGSKENIDESVYLLGFLTISKDYRFLKSNSLIITADSQKLAFGKPRRYQRKDLNSVKELLLYKITRAQLTKIVKAQNISVQLGAYKGGLSSESLMLINNLLSAS